MEDQATRTFSFKVKLTIHLWASLVAQLVRIPLQYRRPGFPWVGKIPLRRERLPTPVFWLEDSMN